MTAVRFRFPLVLLVLIYAAKVHADLQEVPASLAAALASVVPDPPPKELAANAHFFVSDEWAHWLYRDSVQAIGGVMIGVGTDQNYIIAGWARPELLVLVDFDQVVVDIHRVYRQVFLECDNPSAFSEAWSQAKMTSVEAWLAAAYLDQADQRRIIRTFRQARPLIEGRLKALRKKYKEAGVPFFLSDPEQYAYLRNLFRANRVFAIRGDLTGRSAIRGIAKALRDAGLKVTVLYLSNAEKYFEFTKDYKENMRSLPFDEKAVVLRTAGGWDPDKAPDGLYTYIVQPAWSFVAWMQEDVPASFKILVSRRKHDKDRPGLAFITAVPMRRQKR